MDVFSDSLKLLTAQEESGLSLEIKDSLAFLRKAFTNEEIKCYDFDGGIAVSMQLKIKRPNRAVTFKKTEPVLIKLDKENYPFVPPLVYSDRLDFPAENTPHINPTKIGQPYWLCLFRGDASDWFAQHTIVDFVERVRSWLNDAAAGNLNSPEDDFEFTRVDNYQHFILFPQLDAINNIGNYWRENSGQSGYIISSYFEGGGDKEPDNDSKVRTIWNLNFFNDSLHGVVKHDILFTPEQTAGLLLFAGENVINGQYITKLPVNYKELMDWATERNINLQIHLTDFLNSPLRQDSVIPITLAIKRPRKVINHLSELEFLGFIIFPSFVDGKFEFSDDSIVKCAALIERNSIPLAEKLSGYPDTKLYENINFIGLGAVGSKIAMNFSRAGFIPHLLIDPDISMPHNNIRNGIVNFAGLKIDKLEADIKSLYPLDTDAVKGIRKFPQTLLQTLTAQPTILDDACSLIIDSTASYGVEHLLLRKLKKSSSRYSRIELAQQGNIGFLRIEGIDRNPRMDDLMMEVYHLSLNDVQLSNWLKENKIDREGHSLLDEIYLGLNCSSNTLIMPDDKVSLHASAASIGLRKVIHERIPTGCLQIMKINDNEGMNIVTESKTIKPVSIVKCDNQPEWELRFRNSLYEFLITELINNKPNETGGIFIGKVDHTNKIIHITDVITAPPDSYMTPYLFTRGTEGLMELVEEIREQTGGMLEYVGEWHTHPTGSAKLSPTDQHAIAEIRKVLDPLKYPTCVTIINGSKIHPYIFTKYE